MDSIEGILAWKSFRVRESEKAALLSFIVEALEMRGCRVIHSSSPSRAPFYIVFEMRPGERHALLAYAFFANDRVTNKRPADEHRFQIKYGSDLKATLDVAIDPNRVVTTIFLGINPEKGIFVAADPRVNTPAPMSRSVEFKQHHVDEILGKGWAVWERDRRAPRSTGRRAFDATDLRTEVLIGGTQPRLLDLIMLERLSFGLDPGERHLAAEKLLDRPATKHGAAPHALLQSLGIEDIALFDLIQSASRLNMAVKGWVAELHLETFLKSLPEVSDCHRLEEDGKPDIKLRWKGSNPILIECKNTLRQTYANGDPKVDFQRTRASKADPCSRYYQPSDFPILAACLHPVLDEWQFRFALTSGLPPHKTCQGRIQNMLAVASPIFVDVDEALDLHIAESGS